MRLSRLGAYLLIAILGFIVGAVLYYVGKLVGILIKEYIPQIMDFLSNPVMAGAILSGITGMILAIAIAYIWAGREEY